MKSNSTDLWLFLKPKTVIEDALMLYIYISWLVVVRFWSLQETILGEFILTTLKQAKSAKKVDFQARR